MYIGYYKAVHVLGRLSLDFHHMVIYCRRSRVVPDRTFCPQNQFSMRPYFSQVFFNFYYIFLKFFSSIFIIFFSSCVKPQQRSIDDKVRSVFDFCVKSQEKLIKKCLRLLCQVTGIDNIFRSVFDF